VLKSIHDIIADSALLAVNLARTEGVAVFPCGDDKRPTLKDWPNRASSDPDAIRLMWRRHPGPLIGIATGTASGIDVLDVDSKHIDGVLWWQDNWRRLLPTRVYKTRSGGIHLWYRHHPGLRNTQAKICTGIDTRGEGGYAIFWFATGLPCKDPSPPAPWPKWVLAELLKPPPQPKATAVIRLPISDAYLERRLRALLANVSAAPDGAKHDVLRATARTIGGYAHLLPYSDAQLVEMLMQALPRTVEDRKLAERTAAWGLLKGRAEPFDLGRSGAA
jgi:hypothetical protein